MADNTSKQILFAMIFLKRSCICTTAKNKILTLAQDETSMKEKLRNILLLPLL